MRISRTYGTLGTLMLLLAVPCLMGAAPRDSLALEAEDIRSTEDPVGQVTGSVTVGVLGEDAFLGVGLSGSIIGEKWRASLHVPLRMRVSDREPKHAAVLRAEDWDELSDFARVLPLLQYGHAGEPVFVRFGELKGLSIGHGTIVYRYNNNARLNHYRGGLYGRGDWTTIGIEAAVDDVLMPSLAVLRTFSRPMAQMTSLPSGLRDLRLGLTAGADFRAPTDVQIAQVAEPSGGHYVARARESDALLFLGADVEMPLWNTESLQLTSYLDLNSQDFRTVGFHAGLRTEFRFTPFSRLTTRLEYHLAGEGYVDRYISSFYEVERWSNRQGRPKLAWFREDASELLGSSRHGFTVETEYILSGWFNMMVSFGDAEGPGNSHLLVHTQLPEIKGFRCGLSYANLGFDESSGLVDATHTVFGLSAQYRIGNYIYVKAQAGNEWWLNQEVGEKKEYETTFNFDLGIGAIVAL